MSSPATLQPEAELLDAAGLLEVAAAIGRRLVHEAIWHEGRCNWIGSQLGPGPRGELAEQQVALDATLYEGACGVALFLAELHCVTGESDARRTALGAVERALRGKPMPTRALYSGNAGLALTAARVGRLLSEESLVEAARDLLPELSLPMAADEEVDLLNGTSGVIVALLALAALLDEPGLVEAATKLGDDLVAAGEEDGGGLSWRSHAVPTARNLTGLSHGAAGIALALIELSAATGEQRFAEAARAAFDYERSVFNPEVGNWPDLRELYPDRPPSAPGYAAFWCHGGPGIALSRLTALQRLGGARWREEAEIGLAVARDTVDRSLRHGGGNFSLCHGIAGNAEIVADGERVLRDRSAGAPTDVAVASEGARRHGPDGPWPGGAGSREAVGLMLGVAGTGYFYLRAAGAPVPSLLRPEPAAFAT